MEVRYVYAVISVCDIFVFSRNLQIYLRGYKDKPHCLHTRNGDVGLVHTGESITPTPLLVHRGTWLMSAVFFQALSRQTALLSA